MAAPSTFSYAQAAKGHGATPSNTQPEQDSQVQPSEIKSVTNGHHTTDSVENTSTSEARSSAIERAEEDSAPAAENTVVAASTRNSSRAESRREEEVSRLDRPWRRADKGPTRSSSTTTRSVDESEHRRPRKGRKSKTSDKANGDDTAADKKSEPEPEPQPKIELSEAPIPTVNIWQQRRETLLTKPKPAASTAPEVKTNGAVQHTESSAKPTTDALEANSSRETQPINGVKAPRKTVDGSRPERNASRGNRVADKANKTEIPPPVGDAVAWPTPETAVKDVKKAAETTDKLEKDVQDDASQKPRSKDKWVTYDYVPTVQFETQIQRPSGGKARGGGRSTGSGRGGHSGGQVAEKAASSSAAPVNKSNETKDKVREQTNGVARNPSVPPANKQPAPEANVVNKETKKLAPQPVTEKKEAAAAPSTEAPVQREARSERGRGGYRGRGGHHNANAHGQSHGGPNMSGPNFAMNGMGSRGQPYSPPPRQGSHGQMFPPPPQRGGRGGRNAGNHYNRMSLPNSTSRLPPVQTQFTPYEYPMAPMSAIPFQPTPYWDNMVMAMLKQQIEYYFSIDNLCKDLFLRQRMDSQGFVPLHFILAFQRIRDLQAELAMVRAVCEESNEIDYVVGEDDCERLRRRHGWETFVLPMEDRDTGARNHGPMHPSFKNRSYNMGSPFNMGSPPMHFPMGSPHGYSAPPEQPFQPFVNGHMGAPNAMEQVNGKRSNSNGATQLSANVPDFSPSGSFMAGEHSNGDLSGKPDSGVMTNGHVENGLANGMVNGVHAAEQSQEAGQA